MKRHPEILEAAILDGANALSKTEWEQDNGVALENAVRRLLSLCAADEKCSTSYENPEGLLDAAIARLRKEPLILSYYSDAAEADVTVRLTEAELGMGLAHMMGKTAQFIPAMLAETADGTGRFLAEEYVGNYVGSRDNDSFPLLMHLAVVCSDDPPQKEVAFDQSGESTFAATFERATAPWYADSCQAVGVEPLPAGSDEDVSADVPTLLLSGAFDVRTPPFRNQEVADNLSNARVVTFDYGLHVQYNANRMCVANIMSQFVNDPSALDALDTSCVEQQANPFMFMTLEEVGISFEEPE
jgi:pimeloyl-ACP methyl ester carboxylesterase